MQKSTMRDIQRAARQEFTITNPARAHGDERGSFPQARSDDGWRRRLLLTRASIAVLTALSTGSASAQTWTGATSNDWTNDANWNTGTAPVAGLVTIGPGSNVVLGVSPGAAGTSGTIRIQGGTGGTTSLTIQNGSTLTSSGGALISNAAGGATTVTLTGPGSHWTSGGALAVGSTGTGILNVTDGATLTSGINLGNAGGTGTLNVSNAMLEFTGSAISVLNANGRVNFNNAVVRALGNVPNITSGTAAQNTIAVGGLTIDTNGFSVVQAAGFSGVGGLTKTGAGNLDFGGVGNGYSGETVIQQGTLRLSSAANSGNALASSSRVVANAALDISIISDANAHIQSLAGNSAGVVTLGTKDLILTNANDSFAGSFTGSGALALLSGKETLTGNSSGFSGTTNVQAGRLAVNGSLGGLMNVNGGRLQGIGTVGDTTLAAGAILAPGNSIGTLTVGNYTGNGGTLEVETVLGGDASPSDKLVVTGNTAGNTNVKVINLGGGGARTVEGIKIVDVQGASNGTFSLIGDYTFHGAQAMIAGAYAYMLEKNGVATPGDGDWYLRSALVKPPASVPAGPVYQPGVPLYEALPQVLQAMNSLPTLQQRIGNRYWGGDVALPAPADPSQQQGVFWARTEGNYSRTNGGASYSSAEIGQWSMRTGFDGLLCQNGDGMLLGGLTAHYGLTTADIRSLYGDGRTNTTAQGFGATATWYGASGFYVDSQAQVTIFDSTLKSDVLGRDMARDNGALGYAFSVETGKRFGINGPWSLTPQAQLIYSAIQSSFTDVFANNVSLNGNDRLTGRLGMALEHQRVWRDDAGKLTSTNVYGVANVYYEFLGKTSVIVGATTIGSELGRTAGGFGFGGSYNWDNNKYALYGEALVKASFDDNYTIGGTAGFRIKW